MSPRVSFVIPVRNDAARLRECLASIRRNSVQPHEILVVDNGSSDGSADVAREAGAKVIVSTQGPVSRLRNLAAAEATGDVLAFVDADHIIDPGWIAAAAETLRTPAVGGVGAPCVAPRPGTWVQQAYDRFRAHDPGVREVEWLGSGNLAVRADVFRTLNGFDEALHTCEDVDLCNRIRAAGFTLLADGRMGNTHLGDPATLEALFKGELWRGRDNIRVTLRGPLTPRSLPSLVIPIANLAFLALVVAGLVVAPFGYGWLALAGLAGFAATVALRAARMSVHQGTSALAQLPANIAVAATYELARAVSLVTRATHGTRHPGDGR